MLCDRSSNSRVAEHSNLLHALGAVDGIEVIAQAGMTAQLGDPGGGKRGNDPHEGVHCDALGPGLTRSCLAVEVAAVARLGAAGPRRNAERPDGVHEDRSYGLAEMDVLM